MASFMNIGLVTIGAAIAPASTDPSATERATCSTATSDAGADAVVEDEIGAELRLQRVDDDAGEQVEPRTGAEPSTMLVVRGGHSCASGRRRSRRQQRAAMTSFLMSALPLVVR